MGYKIKDENGIYREYDPINARFLDEEYPLTTNLGQVEHQNVWTNRGRIVDTDEVKSSVVDENGLEVISEDETQIIAYIKEAISVDNLVSTFAENSHQALLKLLALQDNKNPLKKGGIGIAYRTDALIMHCKMEFSAEENVVFDAILGTMSTYPEDIVYRIEPSKFADLTKFAGEKTLYNTFRRGADKLAERHLKFEELGPNGDDDILVPWFDILKYHKRKDSQNSYIEFKPSDFFKDLALCSGLVHGAFGSLDVTTQLRGKYTIAMYWFLENKKRYKEYPTATPGIFEMSIEEFRHQFSLPNSYYRKDILRRVLQPAYESINSINECDFTFEYEEKTSGSKLIGYRFKISEKRYIDTTYSEIAEIEEKKNPLEEQIATFMSLTGYSFSDEEIHQMYKMAKKYNRDASFIMQAASVLKSRLDNIQMDKIDNPFAYTITLIKNGTLADLLKLEGEYKKVKNNFHNFNQRKYDFAELEKALLGK